MTAQRVFVDTGAFVALFCQDDDVHRDAAAQWGKLRREKVPLVTSNYVVDEAITAVRSFAGHAAAVKAGEALLESRLLLRIVIDDVVEHEAWLLFCKYDDQHLSFTDCTSFAVMQKEGIDTAFAFDSDFAMAGFQVVPPGT